MRRTTILTGLLIGALFLATSCNKDDDSGFHTNTVSSNNNSTNENRKLKVYTRHLYNINPTQDSLLAHVKLYFYASSEDRVAGQNLITTGGTNDFGEFLLTYLNKEYYYVKAIHPDFPSAVLDQVSTPIQAVYSELEVRFTD